ncbi:MAG: hypothetical protein CVU60_01130 [Deltaproteobacteria bacterium HGW-Deltaproteobacteria-18]|jgi:predicted Zn finger-like uncharacterized protein|nr:MAG: hypothetical protein CVU60_01130 [Deltaproteobacteria bacterium HGW-Deltaproteobacteria-18]
MLVQCPECTTKYNLDESKIGHDGSKVRCTRCKNVFTVFRPISEDVATPEIPEPSPADGAFDNDFFDDDPASAFENKKSAPAAANESFEDELAAMFEDVKAAPASKKSADADAFEDDLAAMLDGQKSQRMPKSPADESFEDDLTAMLDEKRTKAESKSAVDKEMIADLQGAFQQPLSDQLDQDLRSADSSAGKSRKSGSTGLIIGLVVLLLACGLGAVYFFQPGLLGLAPSVPDAPATQETVAREGAAQIALENVRQYFVPNEKEGQLFIIEGKAVNRFPEARELIRIKAALFDRQGTEVATQEFMCGNVVSLYQLQVSTRADIENALTAKVGILTNNTNIQPGASVPFMAVFFQTPDSVEEFGLEVIQSSVPQQ